MQLENLNIKLHDTGPSYVIELLISPDVAGNLYIGQRYVLNCGLVTGKTLLGWTLMGLIPAKELELAAKEIFTERVEVDDEGRYEGKLPLLEGHQ